MHEMSKCASQICPHLSWEWMFYLFGAMGFAWATVWSFQYADARGSTIDEESFVDPPKVSH